MIVVLVVPAVRVGGPSRQNKEEEAPGRAAQKLLAAPRSVSGQIWFSFVLPIRARTQTWQMDNLG
jgi:hypothetical protein